MAQERRTGLPQDNLLILEQIQLQAFRRYDSYFAGNWHRQEWRTPNETQQVIQAAWESFWNTTGYRAGHPTAVTPCEYTGDRILDLEADKKALIYIPEDFATDRGRIRLLRAFPRMMTLDEKMDSDPYENEIIQAGWMDIDLDWTKLTPDNSPLPNRDTTEAEAKARFVAKGREMATMNTLMVASQFSHAVTGIYLVEPPFESRVATRFTRTDKWDSEYMRKESIVAAFLRGGFLGGGYRDPKDSYTNLGAFSIGKPK